MANKLIKSDNRGAFMKQAFAPSGAVAPTPDILSGLFDVENKSRRLTRNEVAERIKKYFLSCMGEEIDEDSGVTSWKWLKNPTKSGLCLALGIDMRSLARYLKDERSDGQAFNPDASEHVTRIISTSDFDLLHRAMQILSDYYEGKLGDGKNPAGAIFWLNNVLNETWSNSQSFAFDIRALDSKDEENYSDVLPDLSIGIYSTDTEKII